MKLKPLILILAMLLLVSMANAQNVNEVNIRKLINATIFKQPTINASIENSTNKNVASGMAGTMFNQSSVCINQSVGGCYWEMDVPASSQAYVEWTKKGSQVLLNNPDTNMSGGGWFNISTKAGGYRKFLDTTSASADARGIEFFWAGADQGDQLSIAIYPQTGSSQFARVQSTAFPVNVWQHIWFDWNDTAQVLYVYVNGTIIGQSTLSAGGGANVNSLIRFGWDYAPATENREFEGVAQGFLIMNITTNASERALLSSKYYILPDNITSTASSDTTLPTANATLNNTSPKINEVINISVNATDETGLSFCQFINNQTGSRVFINTSISGTSDRCFQAFTVSVGRGNVINFSVVVNDTSNNKKTNSTIITVADTLGSIAIGTNGTSFRINGVINVSGNITESDGDIAFGMVAHNQSGAMVNTTFAGSGTRFNFSQAITITLSRGNVINFTVFYNDTSGSLIQNSTKTTIENTNTNASHITNTTGLNYNKNITFNWTIGSDPDSDTVYHLVYWSDNNINFNLYSNTTQTNSSSNATIDGTYFYVVNATDYFGDIIGGVVWNFTLDTNTPVLSYNISNNLFTNKNQTLKITMEDANPFNTTMRLYKGNNEYYSKSNQTAFGRFINITIDLNITGDGNYTIAVNGSDKHTAKSFPDLETSYVNGTLSFVSTNNPSRRLDLEFGYKVGTGDVQKITAAQISTYSIQKLITNEADRISFGLEADTPPTGQNIKFGFRFLNTQNTKLIGQNENALFHLYGRYWLDFKTYIVNVATGQKTLLQENYLNQNGYHVIYYDITFADYGLSVGNRFRIITESIGGLNFVDETRTIVYDFTAPTFADATNRSTADNTSNILTNTDVNISIFGLDDLYLSTGNFSHNASGSWTNHSIAIAGNTTPYHYIIGSGNFTSGQIVGWKFYVYDLAGNELDPIYTFSPNSPPTSTATTTTSSNGGGGGTSIAKCQPYAVQFGTCYYYDSINQRCAQGCGQDNVCDAKTLVCQPTNSTIVAIESTNPIQGTISLWDKVKLWFKGLFGTEAPQLSISPLQATNEPIEAPELAKEILQKANEAIGINLGIVFGIFAIVLLIIAIWTFGLAFVFTNPLSLAIISFVALITYLTIKFRVFG